MLSALIMRINEPKILGGQRSDGERLSNVVIGAYILLCIFEGSCNLVTTPTTTDDDENND